MAAFVTQVGDKIISGRMFGATPTQTEPKFIGWGTSATTATKADTGLTTAAAEARTSGTSSQVTTTYTNDTHQVTGTIVSLSAQTIQEVAVFDASSAGNCYVHANHGSTTLAINDSIAYTIQVAYN